MKKATIIVELNPEVDTIPDNHIELEIRDEAEIPWMKKILEVKIEKSASLKKREAEVI